LARCMSGELQMHLCVLAGTLGSAVASSVGGRTCMLSLKAFGEQASLARCMSGELQMHLCVLAGTLGSAVASSVEKQREEK